MLGEQICDPKGVEEGGALRGMELLPVMTELKKDKTRRQMAGRLPEVAGIFRVLSHLEYVGYEIHMGQTSRVDDGNADEAVVSVKNKNVYGTYLHGIFDKGNVAAAVVNALAEKKGILLENGVFEDYQSFKEKQYDKLADTLREYLNMEEIYGMLTEAHLE